MCGRIAEAPAMKGDAVKSLLSIAACVLVAGVSTAQQPAGPVLQAVLEQAKTNALRMPNPAARSNMLMRTGGMIEAPVTGPAVLLLNTQKRVPVEAIEETAAGIRKMVRLPVRCESAKGTEAAADAVRALADGKNGAVIVVCETKEQPSLLVAPESRWAVVNVAAETAGASKEVLSERVQKEIWRAFGYVMGAANSNFEHCLLKPVFTPADLDELKVKSLSPEPFGKMLMQAQKMGMKPVHVSTYRKAVEEGWAPAPTNAFQKAVWDELHKK